MKREIEFSPAWDRTNDESGKNYGVHGVELRFILSEGNKAVDFLIYTNWQLPHVKHTCRPDYCSNKPLPANVGYHSPQPMFGNQTIAAKDCKYTGGACYTDGSALFADDLFKIFVVEGIEAMWKELEKWFYQIFGNDC